MKLVTIDIHQFNDRLSVSLSRELTNQILNELHHCSIPAEPVAPTPKSILLEAESTVNGQEQKVNRKYGPPEVVFNDYAQIYLAILPKDLQNSKARGIHIAYMLKAVKIGREKNHHKRDNHVDDCGYTEIINRIRDYEFNNTTVNECAHTTITGWPDRAISTLTTEEFLKEYQGSFEEPAAEKSKVLFKANRTGMSEYMAQGARKEFVAKKDHSSDGTVE